MIIWTQSYRHMILGGNVNAPLSCDIEPSAGPFDLGGGYYGYLFVSPSGRTFVAESLTGGIVGNTVEEVREDVTSADDGVMAEQIRQAERKVQEAQLVESSEFWRALKADR